MASDLAKEGFLPAESSWRCSRQRQMLFQTLSRVPIGRKTLSHGLSLPLLVSRPQREQELLQTSSNSLFFWNFHHPSLPTGRFHSPTVSPSRPPPATKRAAPSASNLRRPPSSMRQLEGSQTLAETFPRNFT